MNKEFFQRSWGEGYYEYFSYGVGIEKVMEVSLKPFFDKSKMAVELGPGGGVFTEQMAGNFKHLIAIDVIKMPKKFTSFRDFTYIELQDNTYKCVGVEDNSIDFCFSYNLFCHLSNEHLKEYVSDVHRVLKPSGDFVFMLANYQHTKLNIFQPANVERDYEFGQLTSVGHYYQDERTIGVIANLKDWKVVNSNMIPEHRDIIVHLKKK